MEALFTSKVGGAGLRDRILSVIRDAATVAETHHVDVHIMTFSFTDAQIATVLVQAARHHSNLSIRLIADWNQGAEGYGRKVRALAALGLPNLEVRYKKDQPYVWDADASRMRWSYHASRGLLHHKTLAVLVDGRPQTVLAGSFNWSSRSAKAYENLVVLTADTPASTSVMTAIEREFEALWSDGAATLSPDEVRVHYAAILAEFQTDGTCAAADVVGMARGAGAPIHALRKADLSEESVDSPRAQIAFSSRTAEQSKAAAGYAEANRSARFEMSKPSGRLKRVPVTLSTLALDTIARAQPGEHLLVAMYALSVRVPEYGELLAAARRGVRLLIVLDGHAGVRTLSQLAATAYGPEQLPIHLRATGRKVMHQKYIVHPEGRTVLTGTANFSTDASDRHSEHRLLWRGDQRVTDAFASDFETMWHRLAPPLASRTGAAAL
jgi:hypothetical protein